MHFCSFFRGSHKETASSSFKLISGLSSSEQRRQPVEALVNKRPNRRALRRNKVKKKKQNTVLKLVGVNCAGLSSKLYSFNEMLSKLCPGVFFLEETKMKRPGKIKTKMSEKYIIYELTRKNSGGGGLAIGVDKNLNPVWIDEGNDEVEVITVEARADDFKFRCVAAYGPQDGDKIEKKENFWGKLNNEVKNASLADCGFILQMDGNFKAGPLIIPGDPHPINKSGKMFKEFLAQNSHLTVVNSLSLCKGLITRRRQTIQRLEEAVLDVFVVCDRVLAYVQKMLVDEEKEFVLTNYNKKNGEVVAKDSDHNTLVMYMDIPYSTVKPKRVEIYNLRNSEGQERFRLLTSNCDKLENCFDNDESFENQSSKFEKILKGCVQQSFPKIRITNKPMKTSQNILMDERFKLNQK